MCASSTARTLTAQQLQIGVASWQGVLLSKGHVSHMQQLHAIC
jgi:hypothetical protein